MVPIPTKMVFLFGIFISEYTIHTKCYSEDGKKVKILIPYWNIFTKNSEKMEPNIAKFLIRHGNNFFIIVPEWRSRKPLIEKKLDDKLASMQYTTEITGYVKQKTLENLGLMRDSNLNTESRYLQIKKKL